MLEEKEKTDSQKVEKETKVEETPKQVEKTADETTGKQAEKEVGKQTDDKMTDARKEQIKASNEFDKKLGADTETKAPEKKADDKDSGEKKDSGHADDKDSGKKAEAEASKSGIDSKLIALAKQVGMTEAEANMYSSDDDLLSTIKFIQAVKKEAEEAPDDDKEAEEKIPDDIDPDVRELLKKQAEQIKQLNKQLGGLVGGLDEADKAKQLNERNTVVDKAFQELPEDYHELFGNKTISAYKRGSKEEANRNRVVNAMEVLRAGMIQTDKPVPSNKELFDRALRMEFPEITARSKAKTTKKEADDFAGQAISKPTPGTSSPKNAKQAQVQASIEFDQKHGL